MGNFNFTPYISQPWSLCSTRCDHILPKKNLYLVRATYEEENRPTFPRRYTISVNNVASDGSVNGNVVGGKYILAIPPNSPWLLTGWVKRNNLWLVTIGLYNTTKKRVISCQQPNEVTSNGCQTTGTSMNDSGQCIFTRE